MKNRPIGANEALVLAALVRTGTISEVCNRLRDDTTGKPVIDDASVYLALKRLVDRGLVSRRSVSRRAADGKIRELGEYTRNPGALEALNQYREETQRVIRWIGGEVLA